MTQCCAEHIAAACSAANQRIRDLERELETNSTAVARAQRNRALDMVASLLSLHRGDEHLWPLEQAILRAARSLLADTERT